MNTQYAMELDRDERRHQQALTEVGLREGFRAAREQAEADAAQNAVDSYRESILPALLMNPAFIQAYGEKPDMNLLPRNKDDWGELRRNLKPQNDVIAASQKVEGLDEAKAQQARNFPEHEDLIMVAQTWDALQAAVSTATKAQLTRQKEARERGEAGQPAIPTTAEYAKLRNETERNAQVRASSIWEAHAGKGAIDPEFQKRWGGARWKHQRYEILKAWTAKNLASAEERLELDELIRLHGTPEEQRRRNEAGTPPAEMGRPTDPAYAAGPEPFIEPGAGGPMSRGGTPPGLTFEGVPEEQRIDTGPSGHSGFAPDLPPVEEREEPPRPGPKVSFEGGPEAVTVNQDLSTPGAWAQIDALIARGWGTFFLYGGRIYAIKTDTWRGYPKFFERPEATLIDIEAYRHLTGAGRGR